jgi:Holliday junction resolvase RusA-like endonuclease
MTGDLFDSPIGVTQYDAVAEALARREIVLEVLGTPAPKGSVRPIVVKGRAMLTPSHGKEGQRKLRSWETAVREAALAAIGEVEVPPFVAVPLVVEMTFRMARPAGHWGAKGLKPSAPKHPATKPDIDKLFRLAGDVLNSIVFDDDSRIVEAVVRKVYATPGHEGARIVIREAR